MFFRYSWHSTLESTKWLPNLSLIIQAATRVVTAIEKDVQPVLVHCSDGWDRTTQIVSLAELLLDPYYRTIEVIIGFLEFYLQYYHLSFVFYFSSGSFDALFLALNVDNMFVG